MNVYLSEVHINCFDTKYMYCIYKILYSHLLWFHWSLPSEKTLLMSTPKCLGDQICQIYLGKTDD